MTTAGRSEAVEQEEGLEITIEYCNRQCFHTRHAPEKYEDYFNRARVAFLRRYPSARVTASVPWWSPAEIRAGRRSAPGEDSYHPRLGAFEVTLRSPRIGQLRLFSKLEFGCWPNADLLVRRAEQLLQGEDPCTVLTFNAPSTSVRSLPPIASATARSKPVSEDEAPSSSDAEPLKAHGRSRTLLDSPMRDRRLRPMKEVPVPLARPRASKRSDEEPSSSEGKTPARPLGPKPGDIRGGRRPLPGLSTPIGQTAPLSSRRAGSPPAAERGTAEQQPPAASAPAPAAGGSPSQGAAAAPASQTADAEAVHEDSDTGFESDDGFPAAAAPPSAHSAPLAQQPSATRQAPPSSGPGSPAAAGEAPPSSGPGSA
eukprot:CAMPEP_0176051620 /NCGR_PEP_ID=MMETSP0120_2-20121206/25664_1 /TAXON_ID=160619 /ORGANISM="Kryptoperidinium foliaceum, Strain CCMP 1326" /LENGTH=369 /DNA_ID=CAMNT_0017385061 /DNA_START=90 /DNA_END=1196 /DNA_ORIENTATION=+